MCRIIDTHAHLEEIESLETVIAGARKTGVVAILAVGSNLHSNDKVMELSGKYPGYVYPALGLHPCELSGMIPADIDLTIGSIKQLSSQIVAVGEIGLDYDKRVLKATPREVQKDILRRLLEIAAEHNKPVSLHSRYAWRDCFEMVRNAGIKHAIFHWFTGPHGILKEILDAGYLISCTPAAEYHAEHREAVSQAPLEQLLLETDSPVVYGKGNRYRSNPSDCIRSLRALAEIKTLDEEVIADITSATASYLFNITSVI